jgi:exonuclease III
MPALSSAEPRPAPAAQVTLRMAKQIVRGLDRPKAVLAAGAWRRARLDVVMLQETHMTDARASGTAGRCAASIASNADGRLIQCRFAWACHNIRLVKVYLPNHPPSQQRFLHDSLLPIREN